MKKFLFIALGMAALFSQAGVAGTKTLVDYGVVQESHIISTPHQRFVRSRQERWAAWSAISSATEKARRR